MKESSAFKAKLWFSHFLIFIYKQGKWPSLYQMNNGLNSFREITHNLET
ncbi:hypothetical protein ViNHUV68_19940 [Vibrio sp. NH-UV-68]